MNPTFSIVVPLYNKERYIIETVRSVIAQSESDWELLVVDNNSTDAGLRLVRDLGDARITVLSCTKRGVSSARNAGARQATGDWLVFLDADDLLRPDYLRTQLAASVGADLVVCPYVEFIDGEPDRRKIKRPTQGPPSQKVLVDPAIVYTPGAPLCFMVRRQFLREELSWPEHLDQLLGEDAVYWFRLINEARVGFNPEAVALYRFWAPESRFTTLSDPAKMFDGLHAAITENVRYLADRHQPVTPGQAENLMRFYAGVYVEARKQGNRDIQKKSLVEARRWQRQYFQTCPQPSRPMRVRRYLGLPMFTRIFCHA